jgi:hypothetical protein
MFRLVYVSSAIAPFSQTELLDLLAKARAKNQRLDVTGMLLYKDGNFMQVLEGEETVVRELFACIERDPRHFGTIVLLEEIVLEEEDSHEQRAFPDWSMGFRSFADPDIKNFPGVNQFMNVAFNDDRYVKNPSACWDLLNLFRNTR